MLEKRKLENLMWLYMRRNYKKGTYKSGSRRLLASSPHTTPRADPHGAVHFMEQTLIHDFSYNPGLYTIRL